MNGFHFLPLILLVFIAPLKAQAEKTYTDSEILTSTSWKVSSYYARRVEDIEGFNVTYFYQEGSTENIRNELKGMTYTFNKDGSYTLKTSQHTQTKQWQFKEPDQLVITDNENKVQYTLLVVSDEHIELRSEGRLYGMDLIYTIELQPTDELVAQ